MLSVCGSLLPDNTCAGEIEKKYQQNFRTHTELPLRIFHANILSCLALRNSYTILQMLYY